jgi:hypothetical protein
MGRRFIILSLVAASAVIGRPGQSVHAYATIGHVWTTGQVYYYVNPDNLYVSANEAITALQLAAMNWSSQTNAGIDLVYAGTTTGTSATVNGKNEVFFRNESNGTNGAVTYSWWDGTGQLIDADTVFYEANYLFFTGNAGCHDNGEYIEALGTHEFGHMLGLAHSSVGTATMYPTNYYCDTGWESLDPDDVQAIESLYPGASTVAPIPAAPNALAVSMNSANPTSSLNLSWTDMSTTETGYRVEQSRDGSSWSQVAQLGQNATSYAATGLASGSQYWYRVSAFNSSGSSGYSNVASGTTQTSTAPAPSPTLTAPGAPSNPSPGNGASAGAGSDLAWSAAASATQYDVYFGTSSQPALAASNVTATAYGLPTLAGGTYYWRVVAKNSAGSTSGPVWSFTVKGNNKKR